MKIDNRRYNYKEVIKVDSPAPLSDGMRGSTWLYIPLIITIIGPIIYYTIRDRIAKIGNTYIRKLYRFYMPGNKLNANELLSEISAPLAVYGMTSSIDVKNNNVSVFYKNTIYDIILNDDNTFSIWWRKSLTKALNIFDGHITKYRRNVVAVGIIAYTVQTALEKKAAKQTRQITVN